MNKDTYNDILNNDPQIIQLKEELTATLTDLVNFNAQIIKRIFEIIPADLKEPSTMVTMILLISQLVDKTTDEAKALIFHQIYPKLTAEDLIRYVTYLQETGTKMPPHPPTMH